MAHVRGFELADDSFASVTWIVDHHHDRIDALGGTAGGRATPTSQLGEFGAQIRMYTIEEPCGDVAAFAWREAKAIVAADLDVHPPADQRSVAVGASSCVALLEDHAVSLGLEIDRSPAADALARAGGI